ncbi:MAG: hypothetical protein R2727_05070 [Bacteroidales bacterium]
MFLKGKLVFLEEKGGDNSALVEWLDALIFAVIAVSLINIPVFRITASPQGRWKNRFA